MVLKARVGRDTRNGEASVWWRKTTGVVDHLNKFFNDILITLIIVMKGRLKPFVLSLPSSETLQDIQTCSWVQVGNSCDDEDDADDDGDDNNDDDDDAETNENSRSREFSRE